MHDKKTILITGGAGFIGMNSAQHFIRTGWHVIILDNLSRPGSAINLKTLERQYPRQFEFLHKDIRYDVADLQRAAERAQVILHLAGQVAVTTSVLNPKEDFEINTLGTLHILEAARNAPHKPQVIFSSTNKVYGKMEDIVTIEEGMHYRYKDLPYGISEDRILDFHSPYGSSKGAADQYVRDYARIYNLPTVVFRQSCIYGENQFGMEDQGWVAWFTIAAILKKPITIYGDGKQVRDVLHVSDLIDAYQRAIDNPQKSFGKIYNIGGGPRNALSLLELIAQLEELLGEKIPLKFSDWRPGDQPIYVSNIDKFSKEFDWQPRISPLAGLQRLASWVQDHKKMFIQNFYQTVDMYDASLIIPTYNRAASLKRLLASLQELNYPKDKFEVIIVDNNCTDETPRVAEEASQGGLHIKYVKEPRLSFTVARHAGTDTANSKILVIVDDDITVDKGWLRAIVDVFYSDETIGIVAGRIDPKWEQEPEPWVHAAQEMFNGLSLCNYAKEVADAPGACGPNFAIRKSVFQQVGGFPPDTIGVESNDKPGTVEKIYFGPGDWGMNLKVKKAGYKIKFAPRALVYHHIPPVRLTWKWWQSRHKGEGMMLAITHQVWEPKGRGALCMLVLKNYIRAAKLSIRYLQKIKRGDMKRYGYRLLIDNVLTQARVNLTLARNPQLAETLWRIGLTGVTDKEIHGLIKMLPKV